ncbi:S-methyl-5-thioribose-1-phosphate isomerase [Micromonospora sp. LOL_021]|uniref:S-methyl-5-thioribose-1-phosphate isomerase n=1 Tax=Micromonospora sp. LOL_021 TaxID=3345417 RepID=UPI003A89271A
MRYPLSTTGSTLLWDAGAIVTLDQTTLPHRRTVLRLTTVDALIDAIARLAIRGAPALGIAGALGVALSAHQHRTQERIHTDAARLAAARPTAVNLARGVSRALGRLGEGAAAVLAEATAMAVEDVRVNQAASGRAADLLVDMCPRPRLRVLTHCHTGRLATGGWGTALGAVHHLAASDRLELVFVTETRPLLQGARLTAWELRDADIPHRLLVDSAAASALATGMVDCVVVGADRIAANGDVANKIGTYALAAAASHHNVPFVVVAPESTIDEDTPDGAAIAIEQRPESEVTAVAGIDIAGTGTPVFNPAFDITPARLVTAVVTEDRVWRPTPEDPASLAERIGRLCAVVEDFPRPGVRFRDLAGVYGRPAALREAAHALVSSYRGEVDHIVAVEARGFPLGAAVALAADLPLVLVRKSGKLPGPLHSVSYDLEYGQDVLEMQESAIPPGGRALIVDDVLATGGTLAAVTKLVNQCGASVAGFGVLLELAGLGGVHRLHPHRVVTIRTEPS